MPTVLYQCVQLSLVRANLVLKISAMLSQPARRSTCQFVYRGILGAICRAQNNGGPILSPPAREPAIQKVATYGMQSPYMLYKISCPYSIVP
jgi:hypothetical protein